MGVTSNILKFVGLTPAGPSGSWHIPVNTIKMITVDEENTKVYVHIDGEGQDLANHDYIEITAPNKYIVPIADLLSRIITNYATIQETPVIISNENVLRSSPLAYITKLEYISTGPNPEIELCCNTSGDHNHSDDIVDDHDHGDDVVDDHDHDDDHDHGDDVVDDHDHGDDIVDDHDHDDDTTDDLRLGFLSYCSQDQDGCSIIPQTSVEVIASSGVAPYSYATGVFSSEIDAQSNTDWLPSTSSTTHYYSGLDGSTTYWVAVKDSEGDHVVREIITGPCACIEPIVSYGSPTAGMIVTGRLQDSNPFIHPNFPSGTNGKATIDTVTNAIAPVSYVWSVSGDSNCSTDSCVNNLSLGPIMARVTDSSNPPQVVYMSGFVLVNAPDPVTGLCSSNTGNSQNINGVGCCGSDLIESTVYDPNTNPVTAWDNLQAANGGTC
jgi:hypothetical protein